MKTAVASRSLGAALIPVEEDICYVAVGDTTCSMFVPREHMVELLLQMVVTKFNFAIDLCTGEAGIESATIVHCQSNILQELDFDL